jgi:glycosyltransferase involved in cell wall biosynthesis
MVSIVIPTLNEASTITDVIRRCRPFGDEIVVIDGKSTDQTSAIAAREGARVVQQKGRGKGEALRQSADVAAGDILVFIDADGSHVPEDIPQLVAPIRDGKADIVVGSRLLGGSSELHGGFDEFLRFSGSSFITACINWKFGVRLSDSQNGFRAIRKAVLKDLQLKSCSTTIEQEMIMRALAMGYRVQDVPSHEFPRQGGVSKVQVFRLWHKYAASLLIGMLMRKTS